MLDVASLTRQASAHFAAGENLQAAAVLETLHIADPYDLMVRGRLITAYLRAVVQIEPTDPAEAERLLLRALELDQPAGNVRLSYIKFLHRHGRHQEAAERLDQSPEKAEEELLLRFQLAAGAHSARDYAAAVDLLEQVLAIDASHAGARRMLPSACYRAGLLDHPALKPAWRDLSGETSLAEGLTRIAASVNVSEASQEGELPDRGGWTDDQRYGWGRRVDALLRLQILGGRERFEHLQRRAPPPPLPPGLMAGGHVILLLHVGSVNLAIGQLIASGAPYTLVTNSIPYGLADPGRVIDVQSGHPSMLLAKMAAALRRGVNVAVAADGPLGKRMELFEYEGVEYPLAMGPLVLARQLRARTHLLTGGFEDRELASRFLEGPPVAASIETLQAFWSNALKAEIIRLTSWGPENLIRQAQTSDGE